MNAMALAVELASAYPGRGIAEVTVAQYAAALEPTDPQAAILAIGDLVRDFPDRPPTLGQLREALRLRNAITAVAELPPHADIGYTPAPMPKDTWRHGMFHLRELLDASQDHRTEEMRTRARHPERCGCSERLDLDAVQLATRGGWRE